LSLLFTYFFLERSFLGCFLTLVHMKTNLLNFVVASIFYIR